MVLGHGPDSDSLLTLSKHGLREACVAQRSMSLSLLCAGQHCRMRLLSRSPDGFRDDELLLTMPLERRVMEQRVEQLAERQLGFLLR